MKLQERVYGSGKILAPVLLLALIGCMALVVPLPAFQADGSASLGKMKSMAEAQHEIVILLIKRQEYAKAAAEANKIFEMKWPSDQEPLLLKELLNLADAFRQQGQAALALRLVERNSNYFRRVSSQASICKEMGYLHKSLNQDDKAIEYFKKARDLEGGR